MTFNLNNQLEVTTDLTITGVLKYHLILIVLFSVAYLYTSLELSQLHIFG